jgi:alpha-mannosidase
MDFAGNFLSRLEKNIENNPLLPKWQGELYLEFHRGTYTSIAKNKRNNRRSEFLFQEAENLATVNKQLNGADFPKTELDEGWEIILTNHFHDIIPGSCIREVYEQSDIDYKKAQDIAKNIINGAKSSIASRLDKKGGYVVFNPHSFAGDGAVRINGVTALVRDLPSKGYKLTNDFVTTNSIRIDGRRVETDIFVVNFDEYMQIISIYDKVNRREIIKAGEVGNEIRIYADYPDKYDAWEWEEYSLDKYMTLTALDSVDIIDDGARRGIRIVRPYKQSTITQTIWFWDNIPKIDFDTVADWHQHHLMVKAAFPTNINSDKATYEIQFGTVERPTHKNTSWDRAKFEVCAQKFADLSEGGYGVSIINDCKYGHDIHDGTICLSLFKGATYPNEEADQGIIPFVYSICPHAGRFDASETAKLAYYLNYPVTAVKASGDSSTLPERFSAVAVDKENVICETVKQSECGGGTILRLYESKNQRGIVNVSTDISFEKAYLCDLMENELCELDLKNGKIELEVGCFEIVTIKLK